MTASNCNQHASSSGGKFRAQAQPTGWRESLARWLMAGGLLLFCWAGMPSVYAVDFQGCVFLDQNSNGVQDAGELRQANAVVYLMDKKLMAAGLGGYFTTTTGADGCYYFFGNNASDFTIWIDIPSDMRQVTPVAGEVGQPAFYDLTVTNASQTVKVNFGLSGTTPTEIWSMRDDGVMVSNSNYDMLVKPDKNATAKTEMQVKQVGDTYQGDNQAAQVYVSPNDGTRSRRSNTDEFSILVGKNVSDTGEEIALDARVNPDNSVSFTDPANPTVAVTAHSDGTYTGVDSTVPSVSVAFDRVGNISVTDQDDPTLSLSIDKATGTKTVTDSEYPSTKAGINPDGSYTITDEEFPNLIAIVYANNEYVVEDILNNMVVRIDSQGNYTVIDNQNGECVVLPNTRGFFSKLWRGIKNVFSAVTRFVSKVAGFVAKVARFVVKVARVISVVARVVATLAKVAAVLFPELCPLFCAVASFAEGVARISDIVGNFASRVATIAERIQQGGLGSFWIGNSMECNARRGVRNGLCSDIGWPLTKNEIRGYESEIYRPWTNVFGNVRIKCVDKQCTKTEPKFHGGWDLIAKAGTPVYAIANGKVKWIRDSDVAPCSGYGRCIATSFDLDGDGKDDYFALYAHLDSISVAEKDAKGKVTEVTKGQVIGTTGHTGNTAINLPADEHHLHFEIRKLDPNPTNEATSKIATTDPVTKKGYIEIIYGYNPGYIPRYEPDWKKKTRSASRSSETETTADLENCLKPPFIALDYLTGSPTANGNRLTWVTLLEFGNSGFNVYRQEKNAAGELVNKIQVNHDLIPAQPGAKRGATYAFEDTTAMPGNTYYYLLEDVDSNGEKTLQEEFIAEAKPYDSMPVLVTLQNVAAELLPGRNQVRVKWDTLLEFGNAGFNVYRAQKDTQGKYIDITQVNDVLIPSNEDGLVEHSYAYTDDTIVPGKTYYYGIESVDTKGHVTLYEDSIVAVQKMLLADFGRFTATPSPDSIRLNWETFSELDSVGFNLWRAKALADGNCQSKQVADYSEVTKLTERLIPSLGGAFQGASYAYADRTVKPQTTYCYGLEEINRQGVSTVYWDYIIPATAR